MVQQSLSLADADPDVLQTLTVFVSEVQRDLRKALTNFFIMMGAVALAPYLSTATMSLGAGLGTTNIATLIAYAATASFGFIAGKIALGKNISTLLPGLATALLVLTL